MLRCTYSLHSYSSYFSRQNISKTLEKEGGKENTLHSTTMQPQSMRYALLDSQTSTEFVRVVKELFPLCDKTVLFSYALN